MASTAELRNSVCHYKSGPSQATCGDLIKQDERLRQIDTMARQVWQCRREIQLLQFGCPHLPSNKVLVHAQTLKSPMLATLMMTLLRSLVLQPRQLPCMPSKQQLKAKLFLSSGEDYCTLHAFGSIVADTAQQSKVTTPALLNARLFTL